MENIAPTISSPEIYDRGNPIPPQFRIWPGNNRFYAVEIATDYDLFNRAKHGSRRTKQNFFASWEEGMLPVSGTVVYYLSLPVWKTMREAADLYYRVFTSDSQSKWVNCQTSLELANIAQAPKIHLIGQFTHFVENLYPPEEDLWRRDPNM